MVMADSIDRLYRGVLSAKDADPAVSRTARLLRAGRDKMAKKLAEEAIEVVIDATHGNTAAVIRESADLIYNLVVLWRRQVSILRTSGPKWSARADARDCGETAKGLPA